MAFINKSHSGTSSSSNIFTYTVNETNSVSYAAAAQSDQFPVREQGLVMDCVDELNLTDYTCAIGQIVHPNNIVYSTRISKNRVCIYLSNKKMVEDLTDKFTFLKIKEALVPIRPLVSKQKRLIFSNVAPPISHRVIEGVMDTLGIKRYAPITTLKASITQDCYGHVLSSRRQTYIDPNDVKKLPELIKIAYQDITYFIYPSTDVMKCFLCKTDGHIAKHCPNILESNGSPAEKHVAENNTIRQEIEHNANPIVITPESVANHAYIATDTITKENFTNADPTSVTAETDSTISPHLTTTNNSQPHVFFAPTTPTAKRPLSSSLSSSSSSNPSHVKEASSRTHEKQIANKKPKSSRSAHLADLAAKLEPFHASYEDNKDKYPLGLDNLIDFLQITHGHSNIPEEATKITKNTSELINMLSDVHSSIIDKNLKARIYRIVKRLKNPKEPYISDESSAAEDL